MTDLPVRWPAVAGQFYPGDPTALRRMVDGFLEDADLPADLGTVAAVVAPHAGYIYSGPTAAYAFRALATLPARMRTVFLLGPAHHVPFDGVALGRFSAFSTPLGDVPVARERVERLLAEDGLYIRDPGAHAPEHCLEVQLPFLQVTLAQFDIVPMLFGRVDPGRVAASLVDRLGEDDLVVVSTDLSHYYGYDAARRLDRQLLEGLLAGRRDVVLAGEACGRAPLATLMDVAQAAGWRSQVLDYRTSGDTAGDRQQVVGYAAVAYTA